MIRVLLLRPANSPALALAYDFAVSPADFVADGSGNGLPRHEHPAPPYLPSLADGFGAFNAASAANAANTDKTSTVTNAAFLLLLVMSVLWHTPSDSSRARFYFIEN